MRVDAARSKLVGFDQEQARRTAVRRTAPGAIRPRPLLWLPRLAMPSRARALP
jgi:hypothetical protein